MDVFCKRRLKGYMGFCSWLLHGMNICKQMELDLPAEAALMGDKTYTDYVYEDILSDIGICTMFSRKSTSKQPHSGALEHLISHGRKIIETAFGCITSLFSRKIHAITARGFQLKVLLFIFAYSFKFLFRTT